MPDPIEVRSVRTGGLDRIEVPTAQEAQIEALRRERAGYLVRNLPDRVAAVDAELQRLGVTPSPTQQQTNQPVKGASDGRRRDRQPAGGAGAAGRG